MSVRNSKDGLDKDTINEYLNTVDRLESDIVMIDAGGYYASAAISLKRIADSLEYIVTSIKENEAKVK